MADTVLEESVDSTSSPHPASRRGAGVWTAVVAGCLAIVTAALCRRYLPLPYPSDQINYFDSALDFPHPSAGAPVHQFTRFGLTLPLRGLIEVFGYSQAAYYALPLATALALVVGVYLLGALLYARSVGVAAAVVTAANNVVFYDVMQPLPDLLATALVCWAMVVAVALWQRRALVSATTRRRLLALAGIGVLLGWSYLTREFIVFSWPVVALLVVRAVRGRELLVVAVPLVGTGLAELALCALSYGDPFARLAAVTGHGNGPVPEELAATYQDMPRSWYLTRLLVALDSVPEGGWLLAALVGTVVGGLVAWRRMGLLLLWLAATYVPLVLLGGVIDPSAPKLRLFIMRYWFPAFPAFVLGGCAAAWLLTRWVVSRTSPRWLAVLRRRVDVVAGTAVLLLAALILQAAAPSWGYNRGYHVVGTKPLSSFREWLVDHRDEVRVLWSDGRTMRLLPIYAHGRFGEPVWSGDLRTLAVTGPAPAPGDHVVLYSTGGPLPCDHCAAAAAAVLGDPIRVPSHWHEVFETHDGVVLVYQVGVPDD